MNKMNPNGDYERADLSGVPPLPHGTFPPSAVLSFMCRLTMRSWYFSSTGAGTNPACGRRLDIEIGADVRAVRLGSRSCRAPGSCQCGCGRRPRSCACRRKARASEDGVGLVPVSTENAPRHHTRTRRRLPPVGELILAALGFQSCFACSCLFLACRPLARFVQFTRRMRWPAEERSSQKALHHDLIRP